MPNEKVNKNVTLNLKNLIGSVFSAEDVPDKLKIIRERKELAQEYTWIYHCTTASIIKNILRSREFWLSNLCLVNDKEEVGRIDVPMYEKEYYVGCFSYTSEIPEEHWKEYGHIEDGILLAVKPQWFLREAVFIDAEGKKFNGEDFVIKENLEQACSCSIAAQRENCRINPFYINAFNFYQIIYDDQLKKNIAGNVMAKIDGVDYPGRSHTPEIVGIIKSMRGTCQRDGKVAYEKDWSTEKEIRLKVHIQQWNQSYDEYEKPTMPRASFPKIAVPLSSEAFDEIKIKFSPLFRDKENFINEIKQLMPNSKLEIFD